MDGIIKKYEGKIILYMLLCIPLIVGIVYSKKVDAVGDLNFNYIYKKVSEDTLPQCVHGLQTETATMSLLLDTYPWLSESYSPQVCEQNTLVNIQSGNCWEEWMFDCDIVDYAHISQTMRYEDGDVVHELLTDIPVNQIANTASAWVADVSGFSNDCTASGFSYSNSLYFSIYDVIQASSGGDLVDMDIAAIKRIGCSPNASGTIGTMANTITNLGDIASGLEAIAGGSDLGDIATGLADISGILGSILSATGDYSSNLASAVGEGVYDVFYGSGSSTYSMSGTQGSETGDYDTTIDMGYLSETEELSTTVLYWLDTLPIFDILSSTSINVMSETMVCSLTTEEDMFPELHDALGIASSTMSISFCEWSDTLDIMGVWLVAFASITAIFMVFGYKG